jgi:hypothetical protein
MVAGLQLPLSQARRSSPAVHGSPCEQGWGLRCRWPGKWPMNCRQLLTLSAPSKFLLQSSVIGLLAFGPPRARVTLARVWIIPCRTLFDLPFAALLKQAVQLGQSQILEVDKSAMIQKYRENPHRQRPTATLRRMLTAGVTASALRHRFCEPVTMITH